MLMMWWFADQTEGGDVYPRYPLARVQAVYVCVVCAMCPMLYAYMLLLGVCGRWMSVGKVIRAGEEFVPIVRLVCMLGST